MTVSPLNKLRAILIDKQLDAILISSPANLSYTAGFVCLSPLEREAYLLVTLEHAYLITSPLYAGDNELPKTITLQKTGHSTHEETVKQILEKSRIKKIGIEEHYLSVREFHDLQTDFATIIPVKTRNLRIQKSPEEIIAIEKACKIGDEAFDYVMGKIKPEMFEKELAAELELFVLKRGAALSFPTIAAFGKNAAIPHHITGNQRLAANTFVLLDFGVKVNQYCSDMTRTVYIGKPSDEERKIYDTVLEAQQQAIEYIQHVILGRSKATTPESPQDPGQAGMTISAQEADRIARNYIKSQGFPDFPHTLGHGIGLEVHEAPSLSAYSKDILKSGMVFSVEPGIYIPGKFGVRIEDLMVIDGNGARLLTRAPKEMIFIHPSASRN